MTFAPQFPSASSDYPEKSQATIALILGILGVLVFGIFGPLAWVMGSKELAAIDAGRRPAENRAVSSAARLLGIAGTVMVLGAVLLFVLALIGVIEVS
jgi:hypothetical protein